MQKKARPFGSLVFSQKFWDEWDDAPPGKKLKIIGIIVGGIFLMVLGAALYRGHI